MRRFRFAPLVVLVLLSLLTAPRSLQAQNPTSLVTIKASLAELKTMLDGLLIGADTATQKKIEALSAQVTTLFRQAEALEKKFVTDANVLADQLGRPVSAMLPSLQALVADTERQAFLDLSVVSASLSNSISALPLTKVSPFVAALDPIRISVAPVDPRIKVFGYFGDLPKGSAVRVEIGTSKLDATKMPGGYSFDLPPEVLATLKEETFVSLRVLIPHTEGALFWKKVVYVPTVDKLYVVRAQPFDCTYRVFRPNPAFEPTVTATREYVEWAATQGGRSRPSNASTVTAEALFTNTVDNATTQYIPARARIIAPNCRTWGNGVCEHNNWSATWAWTQDAINYNLSAPSQASHWHSTEDCRDTFLGRVCIPGGFLHGGGGSHANIACAPTFIVPKQGQEPTVPAETSNVALGRKAHFIVQLTLPPDNWAVHASCKYRDGDRRFDTPLLSVAPTARNSTVFPLHVEVGAGGHLLVETQY